jgi:diguanylate cyclase (GGDEF)-like protein
MRSIYKAQQASKPLLYCRHLMRRAWSGIDWRLHGIRDSAFLFGVFVAVWASTHRFDLAPKFFAFGAQHADWEIDDLTFVSCVMSIVFAIYSARRMMDLSREVKARRNAEIEARLLARHDPLTGLPNRRFFVEKLSEILLQTSAASRSAVFMLDLDGFKSINDEFGHAAGDQALREVSERLSAITRSSAFLSRIGGDEFAVIVPNIAALDSPTALAQRIVAAVAAPFSIHGISTDLGVGIGIAIAPVDGTDPEVLVQRADRALYRAKAEGRSCIRFFEPGMDAHVERRVTVERELRAAISARVIRPYYQPVIAFECNRITGFEALARWESDILGWVEPDVFIKIAEEIGIIGELSDQLLRQACLDARAWPADIMLSFNLSAVQLRDSTLGLRILAILADTGFNPRRLELEITETALVDNIVVAQNILVQLRQTGVRIALDDFGTGYATLSQLLSFQLDRIKIDRSFVNRLGKKNDSTIIVRAILGLAKGFGLETTAEGIESAEQLALLKADGCLEGQGYLFGKAVPATEVVNLLSQLQPKLRVVA